MADGVNPNGAGHSLAPDAQVAVLSTIQPLGDDMEASDQAASEQWAATVASACAGHPESVMTPLLTGSPLNV